MSTTQHPEALRAAAQAVIDRWETPLWKDVPATAEYIAALRDALEADHFGAPTEMAGRWYMVNKDGMATLCTDKADAEKEAADTQSVWPHMGPHRAVQLVEAADVEAMRAGYEAARLEIASMRSRSVEPAPVVAALLKCIAVIERTQHCTEADRLAAADEARAALNSAQPAGEYPALPGRTTDELMESQRESAIAAYRAAHGHDPDFGFAPDRSWIEGAAYVDADRAMRAAQPENLHCKSTQKRLATQWGFVPAGAQQPGAATWTPLPGTLPEPEKPVLLDIGKKYPIRAMWVQKFTLLVGMEDDSGFGEYDEATDDYYCPEGWYEWNEHEECHWRVDKTPASWCELPSKDASRGRAPAQAAPAAVSGPSDAEPLHITHGSLMRHAANLHLSAMVDELRELLQDAKRAMAELHQAAIPDESTEGIPAIIPPDAFRKFVDAHAMLCFCLHQRGHNPPKEGQRHG